MFNGTLPFQGDDFSLQKKLQYALPPFTIKTGLSRSLDFVEISLNPIKSCQSCFFLFLRNTDSHMLNEYAHCYIFFWQQSTKSKQGCIKDTSHQLYKVLVEHCFFFEWVQFYCRTFRTFRKVCGMWRQSYSRVLHFGCAVRNAEGCHYNTHTPNKIRCMSKRGEIKEVPGHYCAIFGL